MAALVSDVASIGLGIAIAWSFIQGIYTGVNAS